MENASTQEKRILKAMSSLQKAQEKLRKEREKRLKVQREEMWYQKFI